MKKVTMYKAESGKLFDNKAECQEYESKLEDAQAATEMLHNGDTLREALIRANRTRPWWDIKLTEEEKEFQAGECVTKQDQHGAWWEKCWLEPRIRILEFILNNR